MLHLSFSRFQTKIRGGGARAAFVHRGRQNQQILKFLVASLRFLETTLKFGNRENKRQRVIDTL